MDFRITVMLLLVMVLLLFLVVLLTKRIPILSTNSTSTTPSTTIHLIHGSSKNRRRIHPHKRWSITNIIIRVLIIPVRIWIRVIVISLMMCLANNTCSRKNRTRFCRMGRVGRLSWQNTCRTGTPLRKHRTTWRSTTPWKISLGRIGQL